MLTRLLQNKDGTYYASGKHPEGKKNQDEELQELFLCRCSWTRNSDGNNDYRRLNYGWGNADGRS